MRIMGLDYGAKTIGVAVTDPSGLIAQPLRTIFREREGKLRRSLQEIAALVSELSVERIVIGLPLNMDETEGERAEKAREFAALLAKRVLVPIEWVDERLTTIAAREILDESGVPREEQKRMIDQVAAQLILETWKSRKEKRGAEKGFLPAETASGFYGETERTDGERENQTAL